MAPCSFTHALLVMFYSLFARSILKLQMLPSAKQLHVLLLICKKAKFKPPGNAQLLNGKFLSNRKSLAILTAAVEFS